MLILKHEYLKKVRREKEKSYSNKKYILKNKQTEKKRLILCPQ